ncbi:hypothetical protein JCM33374_g3778 [Metschnikowia sp. JCM 33374]|nr:hypothetical protein JCM33374_g3778 [Metschnikowia sp. JCM 33374]
MYRSKMFWLPRRFQSTACVSKFHPLCENYRTLRHVHFDGITPFAKGQEIQNAMVSANLDFKKMESKIKKQQKEFQSQGLQLQEFEENFISKVLAMKPFPTLLTFEFDNVYTGGKQMKQDPTLPEKIAAYNRLGCEYHQLERGGQVTWHGKGQLTAYLVMDLKQFSNLTVRCYVDSVLLTAVQSMLKKRFQLESYVNENPGVWMSPDNLKICSVGCNIQRAITSYGIGLNVAPDLKFLNSHIMCGLPETQATSIHELRPDFAGSTKQVGEYFAQEVAKRLNITTIEHMNGTELLTEEPTN